MPPWNLLRSKKDGRIDRQTEKGEKEKGKEKKSKKMKNKRRAEEANNEKDGREKEGRKKEWEERNRGCFFKRGQNFSGLFKGPFGV